MSAVDRMEAQAVGLLASLGPWLAPIPSAWLVATATERFLGWDAWVAVAAGVAVESGGVAAVATALELWRYERGRRQRDPRAPLGYAVAAVAAYLVIAVALTVVLDVVPPARRYAPALFPLLSVEGAGILALRAWLAEVRAALEREAEERRAARRERRAAKRADGDDALAAARESRAMAKRERQQRLLALLTENPHLGTSEAAALLGVHRNTILADRRELVEAGVLVSANGDGWRVKEVHGGG